MRVDFENRETVVNRMSRFEASGASRRMSRCGAVHISKNNVHRAQAGSSFWGAACATRFRRGAKP